MKNTYPTTTSHKNHSNPHRTLPTDLLVSPKVVEQNSLALSSKPVRKRRKVNYAKKILNDEFIFTV